MNQCRHEPKSTIKSNHTLLSNPYFTLLPIRIRMSTPSTQPHPHHITFPCFFFSCIQITSSTHDIQYDSTRLLRYCLYYFIITIITKTVIKNIIDPRQISRQTPHNPRKASHSCLDSTPIWLSHRHSFTLSDHLHSVSLLVPLHHFIDPHPDRQKQS